MDGLGLRELKPTLAMTREPCNPKLHIRPENDASAADRAVMKARKSSVGGETLEERY
jgi:hypothetical protein